MTGIQNQNCDPLLKSICSRIKKVAYFLMRRKQDSIHPERFDPEQWFREEDKYAWFHEANAVADKANRHAGKIVAIVCEPRTKGET